MLNPLQAYTGQGLAAKKNDMTDTTKKYLEFPMSKGKKGGTRISRIISMDTENYHSKKI